MSSLTPQPNSLSFPFRPSALGFLLVFLSVVSLSSVSTQPPSPPPPLLHFHTAVLAQLSMTFGASYSLSSLSLSLSLSRVPHSPFISCLDVASAGFFLSVIPDASATLSFLHYLRSPPPPFSAGLIFAGTACSFERSGGFFKDSFTAFLL